MALVLPVLSALSEGHRRGVVHRDLKPQNIFVTRSRSGLLVPKVLDFGISKLRDDNRIRTVTGGSNFLGTVTYVSPEQARTARLVDGRSDEYSMAVVLYQAVTGKTPHEAENTIELIYKIASGEFAPPRRHAPELPEAFEQVLLRALRTNPDDRFDSVRSFGEALLPFAPEAVQREWLPEFVGPQRPLTPPPPPAVGISLQPRSGPSTFSVTAPVTAEDPRGNEPRRSRVMFAAAAALSFVCLALAVWGGLRWWASPPPQIAAEPPVLSTPPAPAPPDPQPREPLPAASDHVPPEPAERPAPAPRLGRAVPAARPNKLSASGPIKTLRAPRGTNNALILE